MAQRKVNFLTITRPFEDKLTMSKEGTNTMANKDAAFGLKAIGKVGQNRDNQGLSEYSIAASSAAIYQWDPVKTAGGYLLVAGAGGNIRGSLNGVFYTDASTSKPTWANHLEAANTATDIVGFVSDDPL